MNNLGINKLLIDNGANIKYYEVIDLPVCWIVGKPIQVNSMVYNNIKDFIKKYINISKGIVYIYDILKDKNTCLVKFYYDKNHINKMKQRILKLKKLNLI